MRRAFCILIGALAGPAVALACPPVTDRSAEVNEILQRMRAASDEDSARIISHALWGIWAKAPDARAQDLLDEGIRLRAGFDLQNAAAAFDAVIAYCPHYAEGYNQRAFVNFIRRDYAAALADLNRALERAPRHVAAMTGKALALIQLGRAEAGQEVLRQAVALHPWLPERHMLTDLPRDDI